MWSNHTSNPTSPINGSVDTQPNLRAKYHGKQIAQIIKIKPQFVDEFKKVQAQMWPEVVAQLKECNFEDYSIFHDLETHQFFLTFKYIGFDWVGDVERTQESPKVQEWQEKIFKYQDSDISKVESSQGAEPALWRTLERVS